MNIAFLAHDKKKELMVQFCTAYKSVLMKHNLFATATTGRLIADNTGLPITLLLSHKQGGHQQINARIAYNEIDLVLLFTDPNTVIYGHNMKNLSMFGSLKKYKTEDFYKDHQFFTIYTSECAYRYQIFAYYDVPETDEVYTVGFAPDETFQKFIDKMKQKSYDDTGVNVTKDDHIMTLSTCSTTGKRFVVHAVRIGEHALEK